MAGLVPAIHVFDDIIFMWSRGGLRHRRAQRHHSSNGDARARPPMKGFLVTPRWSRAKRLNTHSVVPRRRGPRCRVVDDCGQRLWSRAAGL